MILVIYFCLIYEYFNASIKTLKINDTILSYVCVCVIEMLEIQMPELVKKKKKIGTFCIFK